MKATSEDIIINFLRTKLILYNHLKAFNAVTFLEISQYGIENYKIFHVPQTYERKFRKLRNEGKIKCDIRKKGKMNIYYNFTIIG